MNDMNNLNIDLEKMKRAWLEMGKALGMEPIPGMPDNPNNMQTTLDKLRRRYKRGWIFAPFAAVAFSIMFFRMDILDSQYRVTIAVSYAILMLAIAYTQYWLWRGVGRINPLTMTIHNVASMAVYYRRWHLRYIFIGFPLAMLWVGYFFYAATNSGFRGIDGIIIGAIVGAISGFITLRNILRDYKSLSE